MKVPRVKLDRGKVGKPRSAALNMLLALPVGETTTLCGGYVAVRQKVRYAYGTRGYRIRWDGSMWSVKRLK